jgi:Flp pilus assembly pilin Flp
VIRRLIEEESGQGAVEYALIGGTIALGLFAAAQMLTQIQGQLFKSQEKALSDWRAP